MQFQELFCFCPRPSTERRLQVSRKLVCFLFRFSPVAHRVLSMRVGPWGCLWMEQRGPMDTCRAIVSSTQTCPSYRSALLAVAPAFQICFLFLWHAAAHPPYSTQGTFPSCESILQPHGSLSVLCVYPDTQAVSCSPLPPYLGSSELLVPLA